MPQPRPRSYFAQAASHRATLSVERRPNRSSVFFERPSNGLNNMLGRTGLEQVRDDRVAQSNPLHLAPDPPIARSRLKCMEPPTGLGHNSSPNRFRLDREPVSAGFSLKRRDPSGCPPARRPPLRFALPPPPRLRWTRRWQVAATEGHLAAARDQLTSEQRRMKEHAWR
jgi:hypothetical protein